MNFWKIKYFAADIIILGKATKNHNHMMYGSWDTEWKREFFVILGHFLPFTTLPNNPKNQDFETEKVPGDFIIFYLCTINDNHMMHGLVPEIWSMRNSFLSFWTISCSFTSLKTWKIKILKNWKKSLEMSSFYTSVPKIMMICYAAL